jgi:hypothetical protein
MARRSHPHGRTPEAASSNAHGAGRYRAAVPPATRRTLVALAVWTSYVWTTRIRNVWTDEDAGSVEQLSSTALSLVMLALAAGVAVALVQARGRGGALPSWAPRLVQATAVATVVVWLVRGAMIATAGHDLGFVVVHLTLAAISIALAVAAHRRVQAPLRRRPAPVALP